ncbi:LytTR family transcriptional regulator [Nesterenkonia pannonica]|uniref:LytR/AlgR family response regulator transcription factor n=1 Tax=Nesterenkonia pannonica TaxID=1548602 RepID=UPI00216470F9|nr:LytTR family DNA-binding domain-containing protein [Nesterenkonia pannonica]
MLNTAEGTARVDTASVLYLESDRHRITVHALDRKYVLSGTLKAFEAELAGQGFHRSSSSYLVNLDHVVAVEGPRCTVRSGAELPISRSAPGLPGGLLRPREEPAVTDAVAADIPRLLTAFAEWSACLLYILLLRPRQRGLRLVLLACGALIVLIAVHEAADRLPVALWTPGMLVAVAVMHQFISAGARTQPVATGYLLARAFVLAELVASLHWQLHVFFAREAEWWVTALMAAAVFGAAFGAAYAVERRMFSRGAPDVEVRALAAAVAVAAVTFLMSNLSFVAAATPFSAATATDVLYVRTLVDLA